ncbi:caspase, EACC1-associated type [Streptomyces cyanogenus]|uniref:Caspase domain protein n=1 Tax=Streptomyces cyanogenus TaxID=80860 RepID=A0ABX7U1R1_STRCY|nr:caspase family protein [Streptomyces cyanogenus]QTE02968.1 Caspase domain protein [Streptomyces cyanogenus]
MRQSAPRIPDGAASRAVLIGCSDFDDIDLPAIPAVKSNLADLRSALTHETYGILPPEHCRVLADPADHRSVGMALAQAALDADDLLLVYYAGHGLLDEDGTLHLALSSTDPGHVGFTGVPADLVKRQLGRARARLRVLVLDCCFSGRAVAAMTEPGSLLSAQLDVSGTYTLTSTTATAPSHAPPGQRHTAFTAALLDALNQAEPLTLDDIHQHIDTVLQGAGLPRPQRRSVNTAGGIALVRGPVQPRGGPPTGDEEEIRFRRQPPEPPAHRGRDTVMYSLMLAALGAVSVLFAGWHTTLTAASALALFMGLLLLLGRLGGKDVHYDLVVNGGGVGIEHGPHSAHVPWKDVACVGVLRRAPGTGLTTNVLIVRLKADVPRPTGFHDPLNKRLPDQRYVIVGMLSTYEADPVRLRSAIEHFAGGIYRTDQQLVEMDPRLR